MRSLVEVPDHLRNQRVLVTPDTLESLLRAESRLAEKVPSFKIRCIGSSDTLMAKAGREIRVVVEAGSGTGNPVALLWSAAVPSGLTPWARYPVREEISTFHCLGSWQVLYDHLMSSGAGEFAWDFVQLSAAVETLGWSDVLVENTDLDFLKGKGLEFQFQTHLHRLGYNIGIPDGRVSGGVLKALNALGISKVSEDSLRALSGIEPIEFQKREVFPATGHVTLPKSVRYRAHGFGGVNVTHTPKGAVMAINGPGRLVLDVE